MVHLMSLYISMFISNSYAVSLIQETQDIECKNSKVSVFIDKRDRFIEVKNNSGLSQKYESLEFLDSAILLKADNDKIALIQMTTQNRAILIEGKLDRFTEKSCKDTGASKTCSIGSESLFWSPLKLSFDMTLNNKRMIDFDIHHYGVYPNDGTYFLALSKDEHGLSVIDFGSELYLVYGYAQKMNCTYK